MHAPPAFRQQLLQAIPRLRRYARTLVFDPHEADDLAQTVLERALARWRQFDPQRDLVLWLLSIAHNAHMDDRRRRQRVQFVEPAELQRWQERMPADGLEPGLRVDLLSALVRLSAEQRDALLLVVVEQLSYAEAAQVLCIPAGTVMSRVHRARAALREQLERGVAPVPRALRRVV